MDDQPPSAFELPPRHDPTAELPPAEDAPVAQIAPNKPAVPSNKALNKAKSEIRNVFHFKSANSVAARKKLTNNFLPTAMETDRDPASQFAMLTMARDMSAHVGDYATANRAISELEKRFDIDTFDVRSRAIMRAITAKGRGNNNFGVYCGSNR